MTNPFTLIRQWQKERYYVEQEMKCVVDFYDEPSAKEMRLGSLAKIAQSRALNTLQRSHVSAEGEVMSEEEKEFCDGWQVAIGLKIKSILSGRGMTSRELARAIVKEESYISRLINGQVNVTLKTIGQIEFFLQERIIEIHWDEPTSH